MYQVAVMGDRDSVIGYRAVGMTVVAIDDPADAAPAIEQLIQARYAVVFITESLAEKNEAYLYTLRNLRLPAIIPIPSMQGSTGMGMRQIKESVRRAVGIDLFEREDEQN